MIHWYMVNKGGMATLCTDKEDAEREAADAQRVWPHMGPHRAVQLVEADELASAIGTRRVLCDLLGECLPLLKVDAQFSTDYEGKEAIEALIARIESARSAVQAEELPQRGGNNRFVTWACPVCCASVERTP